MLIHGIVLHFYDVIDYLLQLSDSFEKLAANHPRADYMRDYMKSRYHKRRQDAIKMLGGKCVKCGDKNNLQLDHIDRSKKTFRMADINSVSDKALQEELKNIQLLCPKCHKEKTFESIDYGGNKSQHGSYWMYRKYGCRCDKCTKAYKDKLKEWRTK